MRKNIARYLIFLLTTCYLGGCGIFLGIGLESTIKKREMNEDCLAETGAECFSMEDYAHSVLYDRGDLFIGGDCRIIRFDIARSEAELIAGDPTGCQPFSDKFQDGRGKEARFESRIYGIIRAGKFFYITDASNHRIRRLNLADSRVVTIAGGSEAGRRDGPGERALFAKPCGIATDGSNLYVSDADNNNIRKINLASGRVSTLAGSGEPGHRDGVGAKAQFQYVTEITIIDDFLYALDDGKLRRIDVGNGRVSTLIGNKAGFFESSREGSFGTAAFVSPSGIANDGRNLYVTDSYRVWKIDLRSKSVNAVAGDVLSGFRNKNFGVPPLKRPSGLPGSDAETPDEEQEARFSSPRGVAFGDLSVYVLDWFDSSSYIRKIDLRKDQVSTLPGVWKTL